MQQQEEQIIDYSEPLQEEGEGEGLTALKNVALETYTNFLDAFQQIKDTTLETLVSAWHQTLSSFNSVLGHPTKSILEEYQARYDSAKTELTEKTADLFQWLLHHGEDIHKHATIMQAQTIRNLHISHKESYDNYLQEKDEMKNRLKEVYQGAKKDIENAQKEIRRIGGLLQKRLQEIEKGDEISVEAAKTSLEEAQELAVIDLEESKSQVEDLSKRISAWTEEVIKVLEEQAEFLEQREKQTSLQLQEFDGRLRRVDEDEIVEGLDVYLKWEEMSKAIQVEATQARKLTNEEKSSLPVFFWRTEESCFGGLENKKVSPEILEATKYSVQS